MSKDTLKLLKDHLKWLETPEGKQVKRKRKSNTR